MNLKSLTTKNNLIGQLRIWLILLVTFYGASMLFYYFITRKTNFAEAGIFAPQTFLFVILWILLVQIHYRWVFNPSINSRSWKLYFTRLLILFAGYLMADLLLNAILFKFSLSVFADRIYWEAVAKRLMYVFYPSALLFAMIAYIITQKQQNLKNEKELAELRLENLQKQIQPHFLFNILNSIYSTSLKENAAQTSSLLEQFADILRYSTTKGVVPVSLTEEMRFLESYITLQKTRLRENEEILLEINIIHGELPIHGLLLQPFIENGFKFGFLHEGGAEVLISITEKNKVLELIVRNPLPRIEQPNDGLSIGMKNTISRLDLLYPGKYKLIKRTDNNEFMIHLTINLNHG